VGVLEVAGNETLEALLSRSVPQLQPDDFAGCGDVFADEVDAYGGLRVGRRTFLVGSNSFRMYRAMIELFPTFWSPTSTILYFWIEVRLLEKLMLSLISPNNYNPPSAPPP
jgi:hypothetical protein